MRKALAVVACIGLVGLAYAQGTGHDIRFYFSTQAPVALGGPNQVPPEFESETIPTVLPGQTVYLWAYIIDPDSPPDIWHGINIFLTKPAVGTAFNPYNPDEGVGPRWNLNSDFTWEDAPDNDIYLVAVMEWGLGNSAERQNVDLVGQYYAPRPGTARFHHWAVAPVTINELGPVFLGIGQGGIARRQGVQHDDHVYFGFGDEWLYNDAFGQTSALPDLYVIPEPASLLLLGLVGLALRRR